VSLALTACEPPVVVPGPVSLNDVPIPAGRSVPASFEPSAVSTHFAVHYDPAQTSPEYARAVAETAEVGYGNLIFLGPLRFPITDADGLVDVYLTAPADNPGFRGGTTSADSTAPYASFIYLTPDLSLFGARWRVVHEFMHVLQDSYQAFPPPHQIAGFWTEATAVWASQYGLRDYGGYFLMMDNNFDAPWLPLDCVFDTFDGKDCGRGYWQWLFVERQVETYGPGFVDGLLDRARACNPDCSTSASTDRAYFDDEIQLQSRGTESLASRFDSYVRDVWEPSRWKTSSGRDYKVGLSLHKIYSAYGRPAADAWDRANLSPGLAGDPVGKTHTVGHLATRYVLIENCGDSQPAGPDDHLDIAVDRPAVLSPSWTYLTRGASTNGFWTEHTVGSRFISIPFDPATTSEVVIPLTNDSTLDGLQFRYELRLLRGAPTPPAEDNRINPQEIEVGGGAWTETAYAGGDGASETPPGCPYTQGATRGVWYRVVIPADGMYDFDARSSQFPAVVSLYSQPDGAFAGCHWLGRFISWEKAGQLLVYLGRRAGPNYNGSSVQTPDTDIGTKAYLKVKPTT
jgi:hypothetical protein